MAGRGVAALFEPPVFTALGYPDYDGRSVRAWSLMASLRTLNLHLVMNTKDARRRAGRARPYHGHGYLPDHPGMYPLLVLSGAGVAPGRTHRPRA